MVSPLLAFAAFCMTHGLSAPDSVFGSRRGEAEQQRLPAIVAALNDTGFDALRYTLSSLPSGENVVLSPLSVQACLSACLLGARGDAYPALAGALHLSTVSLFPDTLPDT